MFDSERFDELLKPKSVAIIGLLGQGGFTGSDRF